MIHRAKHIVARGSVAPDWANGDLGGKAVLEIPPCQVCDLFCGDRRIIVHKRTAIVSCGSFFIISCVSGNVGLDFPIFTIWCPHYDLGW